jgi:sulfur relay (sulfurtransferase) DsrF/TusC family protein
MGTLMGFDIEKIPLLKSTLKEVETDENTIVLNGENINREELKKHSIITTAPPGWVEHLKI